MIIRFTLSVVFCIYFILILPIVISFAIVGYIFNIKRYIYGILIAMDQMGSAILGIDPDTTLSSYLGTLKKDGGSSHWYVRGLTFSVDWVAWNCFGDKDHCETSVEATAGRGRHVVDWS